MLQTPKFLTKEIAEEAVRSALLVLNSLTLAKPKRPQLHIIVIVQARSMDDSVRLHSHVLLEHSTCPTEEFEYPFHEIAESKAWQLWEGRSNGGTDILPHLLFPGDSPYWGGVSRDAIVVACSGIEPWLDRMIAGIVADTMIALAYDAWMTSEDKKEGVNHLT
ncbi:MAG: hypothetical protein AB200_00475 [Parcubacteria bacterium C7867-005]|nr:MAG: hypothetical protein AB200_00475 [Parcubacteria bacterium C7867-005]